MLYRLEEPPQGHVIFPEIWSFFPFLENILKVLEQMPWDELLFVTNAACQILLGVQVTTLEPINTSPR